MRPKRRLPLLALLGASAVSMTGDALAAVAIPWFVLETTGSAAKTGIVAGAIGLANVTAALFGGPIVDRLGFKRTSIVADAVSMVTIALIPLLYSTGLLAFWLLLLITFAGALLDGPGAAARRSLVPRLAEAAQTPKERANSAVQSAQYLSMLIGPPLGGALVVLVGATGVLWLDAASFAFSAVAIAAAVPSAGHRMDKGDSHSDDAPRLGRYMAELKEGLCFVRRDRVLSALVANSVALNLLATPLFTVVLVVYAREVFGSAANLGLMLGCFGGGALAGSALFGAFGHRLPRRVMLVAGIAGIALPIWILAATASLPVCLAALVIQGIANGQTNPIFFTVLQERTPEVLLGRVNGAMLGSSNAAVPLGAVAYGYLTQALGPRPVLLVAAAGCLLVTFWVLLSPGLRRLGTAGGPGAGASEEDPS
jgi:predicted MFS family arabinose efflux permease